jgi:alcohol dehydrogenase class IV
VNGVRAGVALVKDRKVDVLLGVGGGSPIDAAKVRKKMTKIDERDLNEEV